MEARPTPCTERSCAVNISTGLFYIASGMEFWGGKITSACSMSSDLFHNKSHVVFACGSIEYLLETVATSEHSVMVNLMESVM